MKINLIPSKKLALLSAAVCAVMFAFSHNASAVTNLTAGDGHDLGFGAHFHGAPFPEEDLVILNLLTSMAVSSDLHFGLWDIYRSGNDFGSLPTASATGAVSGTGTNITIGSGVYSYLYVVYGNYSGDLIVPTQVWYIGNLSGDITIPLGDFFLIRWTLFGPGVPGVPDGGTTVMLLGAALGALGMARRLLKA
jgi:protein with PEP-CTERM/exosortase system signal